jgi:hypothetical protein
MTVKINGKEVCDSKAVYGGEGRTSKDEHGKIVESLATQTLCPTNIRVSKGDKLNIAAYYDLELHPA